MPQGGRVIEFTAKITMQVLRSGMAWSGLGSDNDEAAENVSSGPYLATCTI